MQQKFYIEIGVEAKEGGGIVIACNPVKTLPGEHVHVGIVETEDFVHEYRRPPCPVEGCVKLCETKGFRKTLGRCKGHVKERKRAFKKMEEAQVVAFELTREFVEKYGQEYVDTRVKYG